MHGFIVFRRYIHAHSISNVARRLKYRMVTGAYTVYTYALCDLPTLIVSEIYHFPLHGWIGDDSL